MFYPASAHRRIGRLILSALVVVLPGVAQAICDVIPQPEIQYRGKTGALNRVYAGPNDPVRVSLDTAACEAGSSGFSQGAPGEALSDFNDTTLQGWTPFGFHVQFLNQEVGIGPSLFGSQPNGGSGAIAPAAFLGDWAARGVTQLSYVYGPLDFVFLQNEDVVRISGPGGSAAWRPNLGGLQAFQAVLMQAPVDASSPPADWLVTSGTWVGLMAQVDQLVVIGAFDSFGLGYVLDDVTLTATGSSGSVATVLFEPPGGLANAVVIPGRGSCASLAAELAACNGQLGGGAATCRDDLAIDVSADSFAFPMPDQGFVGPVTVAVSPEGAALPCGLATTTCGGPGAPAGLLACIDTFFANDSTCESEGVNAHEQFAGLTVLPAPNDFSGICDSSNPSIPCNNSNANVQFTTDADGNLLVPIDWRGVLVPGTLPIPRLVRASSSASAFVGPPPEPSQTPGAPIEVPGAGFLQSFSPKGLRVDPLFNPLFSDQSGDTELFGSADAEFGVIRVLRRSPVFRECADGARAGLACTANIECPASTCVATTCRGGANDGNACSADDQCSGGECGASLFDFSDRYSNGGTGPVLLTSAEYDAEALNPVAIETLAASDELFSFVRSEPLEGADLNLDGDATDDTIVVLQSADDAQPVDTARRAGGAGRASSRARSGLFRFPQLAFEGAVAAFLESEIWEGVTQVVDGDDLDSVLRVFDTSTPSGTELTAGTNLAVETTPMINQRTLAVSEGLVFFRESEQAGTPWDETLSTVNARGQVANADRYVAWVDESGGLCDVRTGTVYVRDLSTGTDTLISRTILGAAANGWSDTPVVSGSGRFVLFNSNSTNIGGGSETGNWHVWVHDRDRDGNGVFDEVGFGLTALNRVDVASSGLFSAGSPEFCPPGFDKAISDDGRWVAFSLPFVSLVPGSTTGPYIRDRDTDDDGILDELGATATLLLDALIPGENSLFRRMTPDGRHFVYRAEDTGTGDSASYITDRDLDGDGVLDEAGQTLTIVLSGEGIPVGTSPQDVSDDGRVVLGAEGGSTWVTYDRDGDGNGIWDEPGTLVREVLPTDQLGWVLGTTEVDDVALSGDGRYVLMMPDRATTDSPRLLDRTNLVHAPFGDGSSASLGWYYDLSPDASTIYYLGYNGPPPYLSSSFIKQAGVSLANDLNADGDPNDMVLAVGDTTTGSTLSVTYLGAADEVAVSDGNAAFLSDEEDFGVGVDLNGDTDTDDRVVHLYRNRQPPAVNLGIAGESVSVSSDIVAALVSEVGEGASLNGDGDLADLVVHVNPTATATSATWQNLGFASDWIEAVGPYVAFIVNEAAQGASLNGDGDQDDRVLFVWDATAGALVAFEDEQGIPIPGLAVDDAKLGDGYVAFRVNEFDQGLNLNGATPLQGVPDGDLLDSVLHVANLSSGIVYNSNQAATPCPVAACDPRIPYRVLGARTTFLTLEAEQGGNDLDQSGGQLNLVLQHFNPEAIEAGGSMADACDIFGGSLAGVCTNTAAGCVQNSDCGSGSCFFPPGGCLLDLGTSCNPDSPTACATGDICVPQGAGSGTCQSFQGPCLEDGQCSGGAVCTDDGLNPEELFAAVGSEPDGRQRYVSLGRCSDGDGSCSSDADCNEGEICDADQTVIATAADPDADGLADPIDNCDDVSNGDQLDLDQDGVGDACDRVTCGNGIQEYSETCDHGDQNGIDGVCDVDCAYIGVGPACADGIDNDGDGVTDLADAGCADGLDTSERDPAKVCDDGRDNDGDYASDVAGDAGCANPNSNREDPPCSDGIDNDGDGTVDWDGAGYADPDAFCGGLPHKVREKPPKKNCALGAGLSLPLLVLFYARRRQRRRR